MRYGHCSDCLGRRYCIPGRDLIGLYNFLGHKSANKPNNSTLDVLT